MAPTTFGGVYTSSLGSCARVSSTSGTCFSAAITAASLDAWPADKSFKTRLLGLGAPRQNVLEGDLILQSEGDATLDHESLWLLAAQLKGEGIDTVTGGMIVNPAYGPLTCDNQDRCEATERSDTAYNVPLAAIGVDYGTWCVNVRASAVGGGMYRSTSPPRAR